MRTFIAVPATVANLGPGFDILALALDLQNELRAEARPGQPLTIDPGPAAPPELSDPERNLVARAYLLACEELGIRDIGAQLECVNRIPFARGLGSSAAAGLAGVLAAAALHASGWEPEAILACATRLEGHGDNAAAALLGGLAITTPGGPTVTMAVPEELRAVVFMPDGELRTEESRRVVPAAFSREDSVFNAARCALLVRALALGDLGSLGVAMEDRWHQPARGRLLPALAPLIEAAGGAGAHGAALAGAGPSVIALCEEPTVVRVSAALTATAAEQGLAGRALVSRIRNQGARVDVSA